MLQKAVQMPGLNCIYVVLSCIVKQKGLNAMEKEFSYCGYENFKNPFLQQQLLSDVVSKTTSVSYRYPPFALLFPTESVRIVIAQYFLEDKNNSAENLN